MVPWTFSSTTLEIFWWSFLIGMLKFGPKDQKEMPKKAQQTHLAFPKTLGCVKIRLVVTHWILGKLIRHICLGSNYASKAHYVPNYVMFFQAKSVLSWSYVLGKNSIIDLIFIRFFITNWSVMKSLTNINVFFMLKALNPDYKTLLIG